MRLMVNSNELRKAMVEKGYELWRASVDSGLSTASITNYLRRDQSVQRATAKKLRKTFGAQVVYEVEDES